MMKYASFWARLLAVIIDSLLLSLVNLFIVTLGKSIFLLESYQAIITIAVAWGYYIYMIGSRGQTFGKMALNIKVVNIGTKTHPDYAHAFLRDIVGKFLSGIVLLLGYFWMIWDPKKQTWHDKLAKTEVVKV